MTIIQLWIAISAFGFLFSLYLSNDSRLDLKALGKLANGRRRAAWARLTRELLRVTVHAAYLAIGIPLLDSQIDLNPVVLGLLYGNIILVVNAILDARTRAVIIRNHGIEPNPRGHLE